jgi:hypothetical protein
VVARVTLLAMLVSCLVYALSGFACYQLLPRFMFLVVVLPLFFMLDSCLAYTLILKMDVTWSSKMSVYVQQTT